MNQTFEPVTKPVEEEVIEDVKEKEPKVQLEKESLKAANSWYALK